MRNRKSLSAGEEVTDINISPLIDMVFILLIFFIVTTVFVDEQGLAANTPDATVTPPDDNEEHHLVTFLVRKNGQILYKDEAGKQRDVGVGGIQGIVAPAMQKREHPITVNVEPEAPMRLVVAVIDECETGGASQVTMKAAPTN